MDKGTDLSLLSLFLPEGLLDFFDIVGFEQKPIKNPLYDNRLTVFLEEKKQIPERYKVHTFKASGFMEPRVIDDYPIRSNLVSLSLKRRRWDVLVDGKCPTGVLDEFFHWDPIFLPININKSKEMERKINGSISKLGSKEKSNFLCALNYIDE